MLSANKLISIARFAEVLCVALETLVAPDTNFVRASKFSKLDDYKVFI